MVRTCERRVIVKPGWFPYDLQRSEICDTIADRSAPRCRRMETSVPGVCGDLRHTVWMIGNVESSSTSLTITPLPTKTFFNGNVCLRWSASYRRLTIVRLETRPIWLEASAFLFLFALQTIRGTLVSDRFRFKWKHLLPVPSIVCSKTDADSFRWSQTVADHMETRL